MPITLSTLQRFPGPVELRATLPIALARITGEAWLLATKDAREVVITPKLKRTGAIEVELAAIGDGSDRHPAVFIIATFWSDAPQA